MPSFAFLGRLIPRSRRAARHEPDELFEFEPEAEDDVPAREAGVMPDSSRGAVSLIPALVVVAIAVGGTQWRRIADWSSTPPPAQPALLSLLTQPAGAQVIIDGEPRGLTPLTLHVPAGSHSLTIRNEFAERSMTLNAVAGADMVREIELTSPAARSNATAPTNTPPPAESNRASAVAEPAPAANVAGWLTVQAPFEVQLVENGEVVGTSGVARIMLPAGRRDLQVVNRALGFDERRRIDIAPGKTASIVISAPQVPVNINARPWAEVLVDGASIGQTPIASAMMPIGTRQLVFRHPELGERRQDVVITSKPGQRVSMDFTK
jgi:hypothetical protein